MFGEVNRELLDEREEDRLRERTRSLVKHVLWSQLLAEVEDEGEVGGRESRLEGSVDLL